MKALKPFVAALLITIFALGAPAPADGAKLCVRDAILAITDLHPNLVKKLTEAINQKLAKINSSGRWAHLPESKRLQEAGAELSGSWAHADHIGGTKMGNLSHEAYVDMITMDRVLDASVPLEDMGQGFGHLANRLPADVADTKLKDILEKNRVVFDNPNRPFLAAGYHEAHMLRDAKIVFDGETSALEAENFVKQLASGSAGFPYEVRVAAARKTAGEKLLALDADSTGLNLTKVDVVSDKAAYNIGLNTDSIRGKIDGGVEAMAQAVIASEASLGVPYKFVCSGGSTADPALIASFQNLNVELRRLRPGGRELNIATDLLVEPLQ